MRLNDIKDVLTGKRPFKDVWHYTLGNYRYKLYYSKNLRGLIRKHIFEQIKYRIAHMDRNCYNSGSCIKCGCETTALQMCDKPCEKPCYPEMMTKREWICFNAGLSFRDKNGVWLKDLTTNKPILVSSYGIYRNKARIGMD